MSYETKLKILRKYYGKYFWTMMPWENDREWKKSFNKIKRDLYTIIIWIVSKFDEDICSEALKNLKYNDVNQRN